VEGSCEHGNVGMFLSSCITAGFSRRAYVHKLIISWELGFYFFDIYDPPIQEVETVPSQGQK
jgi:hypothetical protein